MRTTELLKLMTAGIATLGVATASARDGDRARADAREAQGEQGVYWTAGSPGDPTNYFIPATEEEAAPPVAPVGWELWTAGSPGDPTTYFIPLTPPEEARPVAVKRWKVWTAGSPGDPTTYLIPAEPGED
jgi:hypothetical protein